MSLAVLADHLASKGRNGDSVLVHMSPDEVAGLHSLALASGGQLTINPETGLPEAFSLKSVLKSVLPVVAGIALGPAGFGVVSSALGAGAIVGGATALATGSLQKGIMAGLGAYGGFGLGQGLAGAAAAAPDAAASALGVSGASAAPGSQAAMLAAQNAGFGTEGLNQLAQSAAYAQGAAPVVAPSLLSGAQNLMTSAGREGFMQGVGGATGLMKAGYAAAMPMMAEQQTATPMPSMGNAPKGYITPFSFDPYTQSLTSLGRWKAEDFPGFSAPYPGAPGGATGGLVALAEGGSARPQNFEALEGRKAIPYATGTAATEDEIARLYQQVLNRAPDPGGLEFYRESQFSPAQIYKQLESSPEARARSTPFGQIAAGAAPTMESLLSDYRSSINQPGTQSEFTPQLTGASRQAYDYLMGRGAYPVNQALPGGAPLMRPYNEAAGITPASFAPVTMAPAKTDTTTPQPGMSAGAGGGGGTSGGSVAGMGINFGGSGLPINPETGQPYIPVPSETPISDFFFGSQDPRSVPIVTRGVGGTYTEEELANLEGLRKGGVASIAAAAGAQGGQFNLGSYSDGGRLLRGPGDGVSDSIPAVIGNKQPARLADGEFVIPARIVSELGNGSTEAGARKLYAMMDRVQRARSKTTGKQRVAVNTKADKYLPA